MIRFETSTSQKPKQIQKCEEKTNVANLFYHFK